MSTVLLVTGEASGDLHGAKLALALRTLDPSIDLIGVGGSHMAQAGVRLLPDIHRVDAMGLPGLRQLWRGWKTLRQLSTLVQHSHFDAIVLVDSPGLNLRLAKAANRASQTVFYYIAPQVWAWGERRLHLIRKVVKRVLAILPFEESYFRSKGIDCDYVGHPLLEDMPESYDQPQVRKDLGLDPFGMVVSLLPGSRMKEVQELLPIMLDACHLLKHRFSQVQFVVAQAETISDSILMRLQGHSPSIKIIKGKPNDVIAASNLVLVASGTATLQAALIGVPMVIVYRTSTLTYQIGKRLVTIPYIGLVNILAGKELVPEIIQHQVTAENIAQEAFSILENPKRQQMMKEDFRSLRNALGGAGASRRAAEIILKEIRL